MVNWNRVKNYWLLFWKHNFLNILHNTDFFYLLCLFFLTQLLNICYSLFQQLFTYFWSDLLIN